MSEIDHAIWNKLITVIVSVAVTGLLVFFGLSAKWGVRAEKIDHLEKKIAEMNTFAERLARVEEGLKFSIDQDKSHFESIEAKLNVLLEKAFARYQITDGDTIHCYRPATPVIDPITK